MKKIICNPRQICAKKTSEYSDNSVCPVRLDRSAHSLALALLTLGICLATLIPQHATARQDAANYFPVEAPVFSTFAQTITDAETDSVSAAEDATLELTAVTPGPNTSIRYDYLRNDGTGGADTPFIVYSRGDTLYASAGELFDFSLIDSLGFDIGFDESTRVDLMRLSVGESSNWQILNQSFTVPIPDSILAFLPDGIDFQENMDIEIQAFNTRLPDQTISTDLGQLNTVIFKPALNVDVTLYVNTFIGPIPVQLNVLQDYGVEFYFAESMGIVRERLLPEIVRVSNSTLGIDIELAAIPGRELVIHTFSTQNEGDEVVQTYFAGWNMVSLPVLSSNNTPEAMFPDAASNTLYQFDGSYVAAEQMTAGDGYWLNLNSGGPVTFEGGALDPMNVTLSDGWNLVGALSSATVIDDPDGLVISGAVFGFDGGYFQAEQLAAGKGYWVASSGAGSISLTTSSAAAGIPSPERLSSVGFRVDDLRDQYQQITAVTGQGVHLHPVLFDAVKPGDGEPENHDLMYALPPVPPADVADIRSKDHRWLSESDSLILLIQPGRSGLHLQLSSPVGVENASGNASEHASGNTSGNAYRIQFYADANRRSLLSTAILRDDDSEQLRKVEVPAGAVLAHINPMEQTSPLPGDMPGNTPGSAPGSALGDLAGDLPGEIELHANYPNPFNPATLISYSLVEDAHVSLDVYNMLGNRVQSLVNGPQSAGTHQVTFRADHLASGVYLYRLTAGETVRTRRMILVK